MGVYLIDNPPARSQFAPRGVRPTGLTVVHTAESVLDTVGPDTGAEAVAAFIARRTTPGSYHDLVDSDTALSLVRYEDQAYQDGTGSNPYALSISFALRTTDWRTLSAERRRAFLRQAAVAFQRQQAWLRAKGYPTTPIRRITRDESSRGVAGFISHAERDPARRTDPGADFPWPEFFEALQEDDMPTVDEIVRGVLDAPITRKGGRTGDTSLRATAAYLDGNLDAIKANLEDIATELTQGDPDIDTDALVARIGERFEQTLATGVLDVDVTVQDRTV